MVAPELSFTGQACFQVVDLEPHPGADRRRWASGDCSSPTADADADAIGERASGLETRQRGGL